MVYLLLKIILLSLFKTILEVLSAEFLYFFVLHNLLHILSWVIIATHDKLGGHGELLSCKAECFLCYIEGNSFELDKDAARGNRRNESFGVTFTFTHTHFGGFLGNGLIWEYADPHLTLTLHVTCHSNTRGLNLTTGDPL